jgi:hypothetical protein
MGNLIWCVSDFGRGCVSVRHHAVRYLREYRSDDEIKLNDTRASRIPPRCAHLQDVEKLSSADLRVIAGEPRRPNPVFFPTANGEIFRNTLPLNCEIFWSFSKCSDHRVYLYPLDCARCCIADGRSRFAGIAICRGGVRLAVLAVSVHAVLNDHDH